MLPVQVVGTKKVIYNADRTINTGYTPNGRYLSSVDKKKVISERNNQGVRLGGGKGSKPRNGMDNFK